MAKENLKEKEVVAAVAEKVTTEEPNAFLQNATKWFTKNSKKVTIGAVAIAAAFAGYFAYNNLYKKPKIEKAKKASEALVTNFLSDSLSLVMNGQGKSLSAAKIISAHSGTPSANIANLIAGATLLKQTQDSAFDQKNFNTNVEQAIKYLKSFEGNGVDLYTARKFELLGDAYSELNKNDEAIKNYESSGALNDEVVSSYAYLKAAILLEKQGNSKKAGEYYKLINDKFPKSTAAKDAIKYAAKNGVIIE
jgi:predicted negative regulator of RcsB-dependent stress response